MNLPDWLVNLAKFFGKFMATEQTPEPAAYPHKALKSDWPAPEQADSIAMSLATEFDWYCDPTACSEVIVDVGEDGWDIDFRDVMLQYILPPVQSFAEVFPEAGLVSEANLTALKEYCAAKDNLRRPDDPHDELLLQIHADDGCPHVSEPQETDWMSD